MNHIVKGHLVMHCVLLLLLQVRERCRSHLEPEHQESGEGSGRSRWDLGHLGQHAADGGEPDQVGKGCRCWLGELFQSTNSVFLFVSACCLLWSCGEQPGPGHAAVCVGRETRSQPGGGLAVDRQRRLLSGIPAAEQLRQQFPVGLPRGADGGGEAGSRRRCTYTV